MLTGQHITIVLVASFSFQVAWAETIRSEEDVALLCFECHTADNSNPDPFIPKLNGQLPEYIIEQLLAYQSGRRPPSIMADVLARIQSFDSIRDLAYFFASKPAMKGNYRESELKERGRKIFIGRNCDFCHGIEGRLKTNVINGAPIIGGQNREYLTKTMYDFRKGTRPSDRYNLMLKVLLTLSDEDIEAISEYLSTL